SSSRTPRACRSGSSHCDAGSTPRSDGAPVTASGLVVGELSIEGWSRAGEESWYRVRPPGIGLDAGRGASALVGASDLFLSHGHLDHALGVPWVLSQRRLQGLSPARIHCPAATAAALRDFVG